MVIGEDMQIKSVIDMGKMIRLARQQKGWSQSILADELGTSQRWVSEIENGKSRAELGRVLKCLRVLDLNLTAMTPDQTKEKQHSTNLRNMMVHGLIGSPASEAVKTLLGQTGRAGVVNDDGDES